MHVAIQQARHQVAVIGFNNSRLLADRRCSLRADISDVPVFNGDIRIWYELAGLDADPDALAQNQVSRLAAHGNIDQAAERQNVRWHATPAAVWQPGYASQP